MRIATLPSQPQIAAMAFPQERLQLIAARERWHFWHAPRTRLLLETIGRHMSPDAGRILDVGCGTGALVEALLAQGFTAQGVDPWAGESRLDPDRFKTGQAESLPFPDGGFAAACAFDVLEHADDGIALRELFRVLAPGGLLFVSVPAYDWLWSSRDRLAGHRRRYSPSLLRARVTTAGFRIQRLFGYQFLLMPLLAASRLWSRIRTREDTAGEDRPGRLVNLLLRAINTTEVSLGRWRRPATGTSLVLVARKPASDR